MNRKLHSLARSFTLLGLTIFFLSCNKDEPVSSSNNETDLTGLPSAFGKFSSNVTIYRDGDYIVLETNNLPNHGSPYWSTGSALYEAYNGTNTAFHLNPNRITEQNIVLRIPLNPQEADNKQPTNMGVMGITVNGVVLFNQYAAAGADLTFEINSFDQYNGHPQQTGTYHYHIEPTYITNTSGSDALIGYLLDGFPVYGPMENGRVVTNDDLDAYHGHFGPTADYPEGIYHYHITSEVPYINGDGFFGTPGYVTQ